jgi:hypothetical protein
MGAYAVDYITSAANNSNYAGEMVNSVSRAGSTTATSAITTSTLLAEKTALGTVLNIGGKIVSRANPYISTLMLGKDVYDSVSSYLDSVDIEKQNEADKYILEQSQIIRAQLEKEFFGKETLENDTAEISNSVTYTQGQNLPSVLTQNAKALTDSVNKLTLTINEQFSLLNNYMMANTLLQQQFLDLKTVESELKVESMQYNKTSQTVKDLDDNVIADLSPREASHIKNATVAKDTTDKINFELPDNLMDEINDNVDISSILGYDDGADIFREFYTRLGGTDL